MRLSAVVRGSIPPTDRLTVNMLVRVLQYRAWTREKL